MKTSLQCSSCNLCTSRRHIVCGRGPIPADILFIGEGPGKTEDLMGKSFIGPVGKLLDQMCEDAGLNIYTKHFIHIVFCRPVDSFDGVNREPKEIEIMQCMPQVDKIIIECSPKVIVLVGGISEKYYGSLDIVPIVIIQSPAFLLRKGGKNAPYYTKNVQALEEIDGLI